MLKLKTIHDAILWVHMQLKSSDLCFGHGFDVAWDEAVVLVLKAAGLPSTSDKSVLKVVLTPSQQQQVQQWCQRRIKERIPLAYILKEAWFYGHSFYVDERVLVPRSPIGEWIVKRFLPWWPEDRPVKRILDLCTGCACLAITAAYAFPEASVDACDISPQALEVAHINVKRHGMEDRLHLYLADLFQGMPYQKYDIIISNPPYVDAEDFGEMQAEFHHEPKIGLAAGTDGLDIVRRILAEYQHYLNPAGLLVVEVGNSMTALEKAYKDLPFIWLSCESGGDGVFLLEDSKTCKDKA